MKFRMLAGLALAGACTAPAAAQDFPLADRLANAQPASTTDDLDTRMKLLVAAGRWGEANKTIESLVDATRKQWPARVPALATWQLYVRAKQKQAQGLDRERALADAYAETWARLPDADLAAILPWLNPSLDRLAAAQTRAAERCAGMAIDACAQAPALLAARQGLAMWQFLLPSLPALVRADLDRRFVVEDDRLIRMPDGATIAAILVRPRGATKSLTALLNFTIYANDSWSLADAVAMAAHGYAGMVAYSRGKGRGGGSPVPYEHDGADAAAVVDWLAAQSWSDGRVGMFSGSYNASTQWGALKHRPAALRAIATNASNAPGIDTPMQGEVFRNFIYAWPLYTTATAGLDEINYGDNARWNALNRTWYVTGRPYRDLPDIDGQPNPVFAKWLSHPTYDAYWQSFIPSGDEFANVDIPVFVQTGYYDGGMVGALHYFQEHLRHRPDANHRMLVGPYGHLAMQRGADPEVNGEAVDKVAMIDLQGIRMQWFDHVFRGKPLPEILSGRINYEVMGANRWRHADGLAQMAPSRTRLYLTAEPDGEKDRLRFAARPTAKTPGLTIDLADRSDADAEFPADQLDTRGALALRTAAFSQPTEIAGLFRADFSIVTNKRDFDLWIGLFEQTADGHYHLLSTYLGRASLMADRSTRHLLAPGIPQRLRFESQTVTARLLAPGSRLIAVVSVPRQAGAQINYGTGRDVSDESIADAGNPLQILWLPGSYLEIGTHH